MRQQFAISFSSFSHCYFTYTQNTNPRRGDATREITGEWTAWHSIVPLSHSVRSAGNWSMGGIRGIRFGGEELSGQNVELTNTDSSSRPAPHQNHNQRKPPVKIREKEENNNQKDVATKPPTTPLCHTHHLSNGSIILSRSLALPLLPLLLCT